MQTGSGLRWPFTMPQDILGIRFAFNVAIATAIVWYSLKYIADTNPIWAIASMVAASDPQVTEAARMFRSRLTNVLVGGVVGLLFLVVSVKWGKGRRLRGRTHIYKFIDVIGPWAMLDVFLCAILVALVKMGDLGRIIPGPGLVAFTAVVILTILASQSFDPKAIWNRE